MTQPAILIASMATGIDVSHHQSKPINWPGVVSAGKSFAIIRVSNGLRKDTMYETHMAGARRTSLIIGTYQFLTRYQSPEDQADFYFNITGPYKPGDFPPIVDVENDVAGVPAPVFTFAEMLPRYIARIKQRYGVDPIIYSSQGRWNEHRLPDYGLKFWVANYTLASKPAMPATLKNWLIWQHTDKGAVAGAAPIDLDRFNGTLSDLHAYIESVAPITETPPPVVPAYIVEARNRMAILQGDISKLAAEASHIQQLLKNE